MDASAPEWRWRPNPIESFEVYMVDDFLKTHQWIGSVKGDQRTFIFNAAPTEIGYYSHLALYANTAVGLFYGSPFMRTSFDLGYQPSIR